jgi:diguanylate cyclase (GGDEF)-like protein
MTANARVPSGSVLREGDGTPPPSIPEALTPISTQLTEPKGNPLRLVRIRLWLALVTMAILPTALSLAVLQVALGDRTPATLMISGLMIGLTLVVAALTVWMTRQILKPAEDLVTWSGEMRRMYEMARQDSLHDALTGLGNHRAFHEELGRELEHFQRYKVPVALLLIDLDDLKVVNDSRGHAAGDEILREFGSLVGHVARYTDRGFRVGGDEFALLMPHTDSDGAMRVAERLQRRATEAAGGHGIAFSAGISACPALATSRTELYAQADAALYWCKRHGRASVDVFQPVRDGATSRDAAPELAAAVANVINNRLLRPVYQPIVEIPSGRVIGFEGLSRPTAESGFADPTSLFAAAETVNRTVELDIACLHTVVAGAKAMRSDQLLTLNVSPRTVEAPQFAVESLLAILAEYDVAPGRVVIELTERETVDDIARLQANLTSLQRANLRIAADDVGAGNAGLRLLSQFRFDIVKIDLSLVQQGAESDSSHAVLRSLRDLAGRWGASVIAEGLETASQLQTVRDLGITAGQGYLLGRPAPNPVLDQVNMRPLETGGFVLESRHLPFGGSVSPPS